MRRMTGDIFHRFIACFLLFFTVMALQAEDGSVLDRKVRLPKSKDTIYRLLKQVSDQSGYLFVYDSQIIDNDKVMKIPKGEYTVRDAIYAITGNERLKILVVGNHILLQLPEEKETKIQIAEDKIIEQSNYFTLGGIIYDRISEEPLAYTSVGVNNTTIGTITNQDGEFRLILPDSLLNHSIKLTNVGYESQEIEISLLIDQHVRFSLAPKVIPLQEVIVRAVNPVDLLKEMLAKREQNYPSEPVYITAFYREGIDLKKKNIDLTEAVLKIYKTGYPQSVKYDQVKMVKMRRIKSKLDSDTIFTRIKSGINSCLMLDIVKELPDFLDPEGRGQSFVYTHTDITTIDGRRVNVISFEQKDYIKESLYKGQLFIDTYNQALIEARFELHPRYIEKATEQFIERINKDLKMTLERASYTVSYKRSEDGYDYINHIRGDLEFKVRKKRRLFSAPLHLWFEMVNCKMEKENVVGFPRNERISPLKIFSETKYEYDKNFWGNFNVIVPEDKLKELIINNLNEVAE